MCLTKFNFNKANNSLIFWHVVARASPDGPDQQHQIERQAETKEQKTRDDEVLVLLSP